MYRRRFLSNAGMLFWLPVLESLVPTRVFAAAQTRNKFVMIFTPSGMYMPGATNGNWTFDGALKPLVDRGLQNNAMIVRNLHGGTGDDPHWVNTAGFLSCQPIQLRSDRPTRCGRTFDQMVADANPTALKSLHVGWKPMNRDFSGDHAGYSDRYLDTLAWSAPDRPIGNTYSPAALWDQVYAGGAAGARHIKGVNARRKSLIDSVLSDVGRVRRSVSSSDKPILEAYLESFRSLEQKLQSTIDQTAVCDPQVARPAGALDYVLHSRINQQIVAQAFQCGIISAATIMYDDGVGDQYLLHPGTEHDHHGYAHHGNNEDNAAKLRSINLQHGVRYAEFVNDMKTRGQLDSSIIMWGSNMSDGNTHNLDNLPIVLAGGGSDLAWGREVAVDGSAPKANLFVELSKGYGLNLSSFGGGTSVSNGTRVPIAVDAGASNAPTRARASRRV